MLTLLSGNEAWHSQLQRLERFVAEFKRHLSLDWDLLLYPFRSYLPFQHVGGLRCFPDSFHLWTLSNALAKVLANSQFCLLPSARH